MTRPFDANKGILTVEQIVEGMLACAENAESLLADAKILLTHGRYARSFALSVLAEEETAKVLLLMGSISNGTNESEWKNFWERFRSHKSKYLDVLWLDSILIESDVLIKELFGEPAAYAKHIDLLKQFCLYVNFDANNKQFIKPVDFIPQDFAEKIFTMARGRLDFVKDRNQKETLLLYAQKLSETVKQIEQETPETLKDSKLYAQKLTEKLGIKLDST